MSATASLSHWRDLARRYRGEFIGTRLRLALVMLATALWIVVRLAEPWPLKMIIDGVLLGSPPGFLADWARSPDSLLALLIAGMVLLGLIGSSLRYCQRVGMADLGFETGSRLRRRLFAHLLGVGNGLVGRRSAGDLAVRVMSDIRILRDAMVTMPVRLAEELLLVLGMIAVMFWIDWPLALVALVLPSFLIAILRRFRLPMREAVKKQRARESQIATTAGQALSAIATVQSYGQEKAEVRRFGKAAKKDLRSGLVSARLEARMTALIELGMGVATAGIIAVATWRFKAGSLTPGDLIVFASYLAIFYTPLRRLARTTKRIVRAHEAGSRIDDLLDEPAPDNEQTPVAAIAEGAVELDEVRLQRRGRDLVDRVSLGVRPGEHVLIVGPTGAGKSTLLSLIAGLTEPDAGTIRRGRGQVAMVFQRPLLLAGTIAENIALGRPDASAEAIHMAAESAGIAEVIERLPQGYETGVGEAGRWLSGGQQRAVAIARASLMEAPIVLLDEPTVGLDAAAEAQLHAALNRLGEGRTVIAVTHELASIPPERRVVFLDKGKVVADDAWGVMRLRTDLPLSKALT